MILEIILKKTKRKKTPFFKMIVNRKNKHNKIIDTVGFYNLAVTPKTIGLNMNKIKFWIANGAQVKSTFIKNLIRLRKKNELHK